MPRLVVVSNRVGIPDGGARAGGLEVAIRPALKRRGGVWFGWSGKISDGDPGPPKTTVQDNVSYVTIGMRRDDYEEFYNGFANRVLWPILHYRLDLAEFTRRDLGGYFRVNEYFARSLESFLRPDDVVWVHDYHLIPLAKALRERGHKNKIGFFIHIPCPPPEILTALPNHERLIPALGALRRHRPSDRDRRRQYLPLFRKRVPRAQARRQHLRFRRPHRARRRVSGRRRDRVVRAAGAAGDRNGVRARGAATACPAAR